MGRSTLGALALMMWLWGCGSVHPETDGGPPGPDARLSVDAGVADAGRADAAPPPKGQEVVTGSGRLTSPTFQMEVQVGHPYGQAPAVGATRTMQGAAVVKP
jgi:hypothetical protein